MANIFNIFFIIKWICLIVGAVVMYRLVKAPVLSAYNWIKAKFIK